MIKLSTPDWLWYLWHHRIRRYQCVVCKHTFAWRECWGYAVHTDVEVPMCHCCWMQQSHLAHYYLYDTWACVRPWNVMEIYRK